MCRDFFPFWNDPHWMWGCGCGPWAWKQPTKEERLKWLELYKKNLEKELTKIEKEMERIKEQNG